MLNTLWWIIPALLIGVGFSALVKRPTGSCMLVALVAAALCSTLTVARGGFELYGTTPMMAAALAGAVAALITVGFAPKHTRVLGTGSAALLLWTLATTWVTYRYFGGKSVGFSLAQLIALMALSGLCFAIELFGEKEALGAKPLRDLPTAGDTGPGSRPTRFTLR